MFSCKCINVIFCLSFSRNFNRDDTLETGLWLARFTRAYTFAVLKAVFNCLWCTYKCKLETPLARVLRHKTNVCLDIIKQEEMTTLRLTEKKNLWKHSSSCRLWVSLMRTYILEGNTANYSKWNNIARNETNNFFSHNYFNSNTISSWQRFQFWQAKKYHSL